MLDRLVRDAAQRMAIEGPVVPAKWGNSTSSEEGDKKHGDSSGEGRFASCTPV